MPPYQMNPINDYYMRNSMQGNYVQQQLPFPPQQQFSFPPQHTPQPPAIHASWVTSIDEAKASRSDDFLSTNIFLDTSTGKIYMKRMGNDGKPQFLTYAIDEPEPQNNADPLSEINLRLSNIENVLGGLRNEKSISGNAGTQQSAAVPQSAVAESYEPNGPAESAGFPKNAGNDKWKKRS